MDEDILDVFYNLLQEIFDAWIIQQEHAAAISTFIL